MKCPKCGSEIADGKLYCEQCGEEIRIVPEFEPEIENSIKETLSGIVEDVLDNEPFTEDEFVPKKRFSKRKLIAVLSAIAAFVILVFVCVYGVRYYQDNSISYQISKANGYFAEGDLDSAIAHYRRAMELDNTNIALQFQLAELYKADEREAEYSMCMSGIIQSVYATEEEIETAYRLMIAYYRDREDYASINTILLNTENEEIRSAYQSFMALPPEFSYQEGAYAEVIPLKLTSSIQGTIYYTLDGTLPDESSEIYTTPIFLETGTYTVSALFVNAYGIESEVVAKTYTIEVLLPSAPEVETYSGEFTTPTMIRVLVPANGNIYYTTDGTVPTAQSNVYTGPIPMPLGKSTFKFVCINEDGVSGEVTTRQYELELQTDFTVSQAMDSLMSALLDSGKIQDINGTIPGSLEGRYLYQFQYALAIKSQGDYYIVSEIYEDTAGVQNRTGTTYAVDIYSLTPYKVSRGALDEYILDPFEQGQ